MIIAQPMISWIGGTMLRSRESIRAKTISMVLSRLLKEAGMYLRDAKRSP